MKKYYFASGIRGIVGEHSGNIRGAKAKAQKLAEQLDEEITIFVRSNKEIDCGKNIPANEEVCRVCNADGDVLAVCSTYGNAFAWCAENGIEGEIGEYEPYIEVGTYSENGNFEVEDYSSINTGDGMWNIINDYCYYFDKVCPEVTAETVETEEKAEEEIITMGNQNKNMKEVITMKATKYTNKELVEIYKSLKTSAKILGFSSASDSEMIAEIELEAIKRHLNLIDGTVEETAELETETNETTVETTAEQTEADEAAETEPAKTPKSENVPYKMKWTNQNVDYSRANYTAVIFKFNNSKVWLQSDCVCSTQTARAIIRKLGKRFGSKSVDVKYFSDQTNEKIVSVCQLYDNSGYIFRSEIAVKNGEKRQFIKYAAKEIFE